MNMRSFASILADREGGIYLEPGHTRSNELTGLQVEKIFGEIPVISVQYGYTVSVHALKNGNYEVVVRRES